MGLTLLLPLWRMVREDWGSMIRIGWGKVGDKREEFQGIMEDRS